MPAPKKLLNKPNREILRRSENLKVKKRVGKFVILFILVFLLVASLICVLYIPALSVRTIYVQGNDILDSEDIVAQAEKDLSGKYWYLFPRKSIFIYPQKIIAENLKKEFSRLQSVEIGISEYDSLIINVKERDSDSIWCKGGESSRDILGQIIETETSTTTIVEGEANLSTEGCYFSDSAGFIFAPAPYFSNSVFMELSGLLAEQPITTAPLPEQSYSIITHFAKNLSKIFNKTEYDMYRLIKVIVVDNNNYEALVTDTSKENGEWKIFFDNDESAEELINNLYTVLNSDPFKKEMLANKGNLASIDLRYGKKVFYRFK